MIYNEHTDYESPLLMLQTFEVEAGFAGSLFFDNDTIDSPWFDDSDENMWNF